MRCTTFAVKDSFSNVPEKVMTRRREGPGTTVARLHAGAALDSGPERCETVQVTERARPNLLTDSQHAFPPERLDEVAQLALP